MCQILKIWNHFLIFGYHCTRIAIYYILYSSLDSNLLHEKFLPHNILIDASRPNLDSSEEALNEDLGVIMKYNMHEPVASSSSDESLGEFDDEEAQTLLLK